MASSNKTQYLGLNVWAATDPVLRDDFNADNQRLDTALGAVMTLPGLYYVSGSWVGDNQTVGPGQQKAEMSLSFDFEPLVVFIAERDTANQNRVFLFKPMPMVRASFDTASSSYLNLTWTATGVSWYGSMTQASYNYNFGSTAYIYGAIGRKTP